MNGKNHPVGTRRRNMKQKKRKPISPLVLFALLIVVISCVIVIFVAKNRSETDASNNLQNLPPMTTNEEDVTGESASEIETPVPNFDQADTISTDIGAANAVLMQADTHAVLYQKEARAKIAPASTAKLITALTVLDICAQDDVVTVGTEIMMMQQDASRAWLNQGDTLTIRQLLIALLLPSGNDAAYTLAVHTGRKIAQDDNLTETQAVEVFMDAVNEKAKSLGAVNSNFVVPDGYDADGQYTTAVDLAMIADACLDNACIAQLIGTYRSYEKWTSGREVTYYNTNQLLDSSSPFYYPEAIGIKTGSTGLAGDCLVSAAEINGKTYICVVMGAATSDARYQDSIQIYDAIKLTQ